jgi:hypothetical protein
MKTCALPLLASFSNPNGEGDLPSLPLFSYPSFPSPHFKDLEGGKRIKRGKRRNKKGKREGLTAITSSLSLLSFKC